MGRARVLVVDDERMIRWSVQQALVADGHKVASVETGEEALVQAAEEMPDIVFLDITLPGMDGIQVLQRLKEMDKDVCVVIISAMDDLRVAVDSIRMGAYDYLSKPFELDRIRVIARNASDRQELRQEVEYHRKSLVRKHGFHRLVGESRELREVIEMGRKVSLSETATVLLQGESGTGKDLLAQAIHYEGKRASKPFMPINCTALPDDLLESELMGHEKGAFTDAKFAKRGLFEITDGGTVFLDEIGDMKIGLQGKLLRFIETHSFRRVGGHRDYQVDVRIIAATNRDLLEGVRRGLFREDLFFRLNVVPIVLPPLRMRKEDIPRLAEHFLAELSKDLRRPSARFSEESYRRMEKYHWPGNVRELKNAVERSLILGSEDTLEVVPGATGTVFSDGEDTRFALRGGEGSGSGVPGPGPIPDSAPDALSSPRQVEEGEAGKVPIYRFPLPEKGVDIEEVEKEMILQALEKTSGNQSRAARLLALTRDALRYRMKKFGIPS